MPEQNYKEMEKEKIYKYFEHMVNIQVPGMTQMRNAGLPTYSVKFWSEL